MLGSGSKAAFGVAFTRRRRGDDRRRVDCAGGASATSGNCTTDALRDRRTVGGLTSSCAFRARRFGSSINASAVVALRRVDTLTGCSASTVFVLVVVGLSTAWFSPAKPRRRQTLAVAFVAPRVVEGVGKLVSRTRGRERGFRVEFVAAVGASGTVFSIRRCIEAEHYAATRKRARMVLGERIQFRQDSSHERA
jgi:hypothetical protein